MPPESIALTCRATVVSHAGGRAVLDSGSKALAADRAAYNTGAGRLLDHPDARIVLLSEHHAVVDLAGAPLPRVGEEVDVVPNHCCAAVNLDRRPLGRGGRRAAVVAGGGPRPEQLTGASRVSACRSASPPRPRPAPDRRPGRLRRRHRDRHGDRHRERQSTTAARSRPTSPVTTRSTTRSRRPRRWTHRRASRRSVATSPPRSRPAWATSRSPSTRPAHPARSTRSCPWRPRATSTTVRAIGSPRSTRAASRSCSAATRAAPAAAAPATASPTRPRATRSTARASWRWPTAGPDTNGSQFFIVYDDSPLNPDYTVFGTVDDDSLKKIQDLAAKGTVAGPGRRDRARREGHDRVGQLALVEL